MQVIKTLISQKKPISIDLKYPQRRIMDKLIIYSFSLFFLSIYQYIHKREKCDYSTVTQKKVKKKGTIAS